MKSKFYLGILTAVCSVSLALNIYSVVNGTSRETNLYVGTESTVESEKVYVICDVDGIFADDDHISVEVVMPNGEIHEYWYSYDNDLPEEFDEVVMETSNLDDYSTYTLVGLR